AAPPPSLTRAYVTRCPPRPRQRPRGTSTASVILHGLGLVHLLDTPGRQTFTSDLHVERSHDPASPIRRPRSPLTSTSAPRARARPRARHQHEHDHATSTPSATRATSRSPPGRESP